MGLSLELHSHEVKCWQTSAPLIPIKLTTIRVQYHFVFIGSRVFFKIFNHNRQKFLKCFLRAWTHILYFSSLGSAASDSHIRQMCKEMFKANIFWYLIHSFSVTAPLAQWLRLNFISYGIFLSVARVETAYESICDLSRNHLFQWLRLCFAFAIFSEQMTSFASETWTITFVFQIFESSSWVIFLRIRLNASSVYFPFKWPSLILAGVSSSVAFFFQMRWHWGTNSTWRSSKTTFEFCMWMNLRYRSVPFLLRTNKRLQLFACDNVCIVCKNKQTLNPK